MVTKDFKVFVWGQNQCGQCGFPQEEKEIAVPKELKSPLWNETDNKIINVSCGDRHTVMITEKNRVIVFGGNYNYQLGLGYTVDVFEPTENDILIGKDIIRAYCGSRHSLFLATDGSLYSCGFGYFGQLGHGSNSDEKFPKLIEISQKFIQISTKEHLVVALNDKFQVFMWGGKKDESNSDLGQMGIFNSPVCIIQTTINGRRVTDVAASGSHCLARTVDGAVYCWGHSLKNCGYMNYIYDVVFGGKTENPTPAQQKLMDKKLDYSQKFLILKPNKPSSAEFGEKELEGPVINSEASLKVSNRFPMYRNHFFGKEKIVSIACTESMNYAVTEEGCVWTWGDAKSEFENSTEDFDYPQKIDFCGEKICKLICGVFHGFGLVGEPKDMAAQGIDVHNYLPTFDVKKHHGN